MKTINLAAFPFTFLSAVMLGGCVLAEPIEGNEAQTEEMTEPEAIAEAESAQLTSINTYGAYVSFESYGDVMKVLDTEKDGYPAVGEMFWFNQCWNHGGYGTIATCDWDTPEITVKYRACRGNPWTKQVFGCGGWMTVNAGAGK